MTTTTTSTESQITADAFEALLDAEMAFKGFWGFTTESIGVGTCRMRLPIRPDFDRPGGIVGGPILFGLVDACMYGVVLSLIGLQPMATTTDISIRFMRPAKGEALIAEGRCLRAGKRLVIAEVSIHTPDDTAPICHATGTYSVPPPASSRPVPLRPIPSLRD